MTTSVLDRSIVGTSLRVDAAALAPGGLLGVVLCGGQSRRMGFDKGAAELDGSTLVELAARTLLSLTPEVVLACGPQPRYGDTGLPHALDAAGLCGPTAGLVAAFEQTGAEWALVLACDMPSVAPAAFLALLDAVRGGDLDACCFAGATGEDPLCGVYRRDLAPAMRAAQAAGRLRVNAFRDFPRAGGALPRTATLDWEIARAAMDGREFDPARNLNTPEDLESERRRRGGEERA